MSSLIRQVKRLLLSTVIVSAGWTLPVQAQLSDAQVGALVEALRLAAPQTGIENDGLYSDWQIKPENIPRWSRQCTGKELTPTQFQDSPVTARSILVCVMRDVFNEQYGASNSNESLAVQRTASWWMTGDATRYNSTPTNSYTQKVLNVYQQQRSNRQSQQPATPQQPTASQPQPAPQPATPQQPVPQATQTTARSSSPSQISNAQVRALVEALRLAAPQTGVQNDGLYSEWQVKAENIPRWSKQCTDQELTPTQFQDNPVTARAILVCVMRDVIKEQYSASNNNETLAVQRAASWWMTGNPGQYNSGSIATYTQRVLDFYQQSQLKFFSHI
ncbi:MAG: hypothetical protein F6K28_16395 [Microcoleus sp. SIO2G3]|nr:hypothetical protein [Microcoleus sp. SIO2G3]